MSKMNVKTMFRNSNTDKPMVYGAHFKLTFGGLI